MLSRELLRVRPQQGGRALRRALCFTVVAIALALGANGASAAARTAKNNTTVVVAIPEFPQGVDMNVDEGIYAWLASAQTQGFGMDWKRIKYPYPSHDGINNRKIPGFTYPAVKRQLMQPGILKACTTAKGGRVATYHLRHGVMSPWGNEFVAQDIIWNVKRDIAAKGSGLFMLDSVNAASPKQWKVINKYTVRIRSSRPMPLICQINANLYWTYYDAVEAKKHATKKDPWAHQWVNEHGGSFGPYYISQWVSGQKIVMSANPHYYAGVPKIKTVVFEVVPEEANRVALLKSGAVQIAMGLSPDDIQALKSVKNVHPAAVESQLFEEVILNNKQAPFNNVKVRQALSNVTPRSDILKSIFHGLGSKWQGVSPSIFPGYIPFRSYGDSNVAKAKTLLSAAGYPNGFKAVLSYNVNDPVQGNIAVALKSAYAQVGVDLTLQSVPGNAYTSQVSARKFQMALWSDDSIQPNLNYTLRVFFASNSFPNYAGYANKRVDNILNKCVSEKGKKINSCNAPAARIVYQQAPNIWLCQTDWLAGVSSRLAGFGWWTTQYFRANKLHYIK